MSVQQCQRPSQQKQRTTQPSSVSRTAGPGYNAVSESSNLRADLGQSYYQDAKKLIGDALSADEHGDRMSALELYNSCLSTLRSGLALLHSGTPGEDSSLQQIREKMERMKEQIKSRMEVLLHYEVEARSLDKSTSSRSLSDTAASTTGQASTEAGKTGLGRSGVREEAKADVLFNADTGIGLFEVDQKDHVRKYDDADALTLFKYRTKIEGQPPAFLQCGGFVYPLIPGRSPILKSGDRVYMFPDLRSDDGRSVGVSLDSASSAQIAQLDELLTQHALLRTSEEVVPEERAGQDQRQGVVGLPKGTPTWGSSVAGGLDKGVSWVSSKIAQGTEVAGSLIIKGANKIRDHTEPNEKPTEIPVAVEKGVHVTRKASECVVGVSSFFMTSLAKMTVRVGRGVKEMVEDTEYVKSKEVNPHVKEAWTVTKSGLKGAAEVFTDLKRGASAVVKGMGKETAHTVGHKYGEQAGRVADDSLATAGNTATVLYTYWSWKTWGITLLGKVGEVMTKKEERSN